MRCTLFLSANVAEMKPNFTKNPISHYIIVILLAVSGCKKTDTITDPITIPVPTPNANTAKALLREIKWITDGAMAELVYHPDSTLKTLHYHGTGSAYAVDYSYDQKRVVSSSVGNILHHQEFIYDANKRITTIISRETLSGTDHQDLEFTYGANGQVSAMKHYQTGVSGKILASTSTYEYDNNLLSKIVTNQRNGDKTIITIEAHSKAFDYDPLAFVGTSLGNYFQLYNLPVLGTLKGLPSRYTRTTDHKGLPSELVNSNFVISNKKIIKQTILTSFANHPQFDYISEMEYKY